MLIDNGAADEGAEELVVQVVAVGHDHEGEAAGDDAPYFLRKEGHGVGLAAALGVPKDAEAAEVGVGALDEEQLIVAASLSVTLRRGGQCKCHVGNGGAVAKTLVR